jgi:hypothetical protein
MSTATPSQVTDTSQRTKIFDYKVPIQVGDQKADITGTLFWVGQDGGLPLLPFIALGGLTLIGIALLIRRRRRIGDAGTAPEEPVQEAW